MHKNNVFGSIILFSLLLLLSSCSTNNTVTAPSKTQPIEEIVAEATDLSAQQQLDYAQTLKPREALIELITAAKLFYQEHDYLKALWLTDKVIPLLDEEIPNVNSEKVYLSLIKASSLQQLSYFEESYAELNKLASFANAKNVSLPATFYQLQYAAYKYQKRPISAINAQLHRFNTTESAVLQKELIRNIAHHFSQLSYWQLDLVAKDKAPNSKGWVELTSIANKYSSNKSQLTYHTKMWQKKFRKHPANLIATELLSTDLIEANITNVAVILPLTGKNSSAGLAIQQGILASFDNNPANKLHFIDVNSLNWHGLTNQLATDKIDYVIGPLLKQNVDKYIEYTSAGTQAQNNYLLNSSAPDFDLNNYNTDPNSVQNNNNIAHGFSHVNLPQTTQYNDFTGTVSLDSNAVKTPLNIPTLLLNIPEKEHLASHHTVLSMRPEDEAKQAATSLSRKNFKHPIVLSQQNTISKRIAQAFVKQWFQVTGQKIDTVYYDSGSQMQANIKSSLSVDNSQLRIKTLQRQLNKTIKTQTRNRRDVDMIYLVGNPEQSRLVKPYIEVNISPFSEVIPVYASSRSHSTKNDYSSNTDLQGLTFTEIPWLLRDKQNHQLAELSQSLWPKRNDGLSRLFAMGYDSYQLVNKIPLMQQAPYLQHWGQTGILKLGDNAILTRSFFWGEYQLNKVASVVVE